MLSVLLASQCYSKDWLSLASGGWRKKVDSIGYSFHSTLMGINNVDDVGEVEEAFENQGLATVSIPDSYLDTLRLLGIERSWLVDPETGKDGYNYAIGPLTAVVGAFLMEYRYLCYLQGDVLVEGDFVSPAIRILESEPDVMAVSPLSEVNTWHDASGYDQEFSDHAWVVRVSDFMDPETYAVPGRDENYPEYGGNNFEHMVGKYLKKSGKKRKILTDFWAHHPVQ